MAETPEKKATVEKIEKDTKASNCGCGCGCVPSLKEKK